VAVWKTVHRGISVSAPEAPSDVMNILLAAPMPPPYHGGIANWTRIITVAFRAWSSVKLDCYNTVVRYRSVTNTWLPLRLIGGSLKAIKDIYALSRQMRSQRPDILHLCTSAGPALFKDLLLLSVARRLNVPSVIHFRTGRLAAKAAQGGFGWWFRRRVMSLASAVVVLDKRSEACVKSALPHSRIVLLPNTVETEVIDAIRARWTSRSQSPTAPRRIIYLGQVLPAKGIVELVTACAQLRDCPLVLEIVGPVAPSFRRKLEDLAHRSGGGAWLQFGGTVEHEEAIVRMLRSDLVVLPSYTEGAPNVVLEAMACGKAVLATTVGAVPEMLDIGRPEECGICVPPKAVEELRAALAELLRNDDRRRDLGEKGYRRAQRLYSVPVVCRQLADLWTSLKGQSPRNSADSQETKRCARTVAESAE
jgi:glycosyltransferase involved in cell wall biosynthesis